MHRSRLRVVAVSLTIFVLSACGLSNVPSSLGGEGSPNPAGGWLPGPYSFPVPTIDPPGFAVGYEAPDKDIVEVVGKLGSPETLKRAGVANDTVDCQGVDPASSVAVPMEWVITLESQRPIDTFWVGFSPVMSRSGAFLVDSLGQAYCPGVAAGQNAVWSLKPGAPLSMSFVVVIPHESMRSNGSSYLSEVASDTLISGGPRGSLFPFLSELSGSTNGDFLPSPPWGGSVIRCDRSQTRFISMGWPFTGDRAICPNGGIPFPRP
jgi:hypothetical protein